MTWPDQHQGAKKIAGSIIWFRLLKLAYWNGTTSVTLFLRVEKNYRRSLRSYILCMLGLWHCHLRSNVDKIGSKYRISQAAQSDWLVVQGTELLTSKTVTRVTTNIFRSVLSLELLTSSLTDAVVWPLAAGWLSHIWLLLRPFVSCYNSSRVCMTTDSTSRENSAVLTGNIESSSRYS